MLIGVQDVHYCVGDIDRAVAFYRDILGMRVCERAPQWCSLDFFGARVGLSLRHGESVTQPDNASGGATLTLRSTDLASDLDYLQRCGVRIVSRDAHPWGHIAEILDSEGNRLKLMQPPPRKEPK